MSCKCQKCGKQYKVDIIIPDSVWESIKPLNKGVGSGLLCGPCIMNGIESLGKYDAYKLLKM